jgi:hypothetical protein
VVIATGYVIAQLILRLATGLHSGYSDGLRDSTVEIATGYWIAKWI